MPDNSITQWEYTTYRTTIGDTNLEKEMEKLGNQGWEQSGSVVDGGGTVNKLIFKRPKRNNNQQMKNDYDPIYSR